MTTGRGDVLPEAPLAEVIAATPDTHTFVGIIKAIGASNPEAGEPVTLLIPSNAAFEALGEGGVEKLKEDVEKLREIFRDHVIPGRLVYAADLTDGSSLVTDNKLEVTVSVSEAGVVTLQAPNGGSTASVVTPDIRAVDTVVHVIDDILIAGSS